MSLRFASCFLRRFAASRSGVAATEFAVILPFMLGVGLMGLEVANRTVVQMRVSQLAIHIAVNASRFGDTATLQDRGAPLNAIFGVFAGIALFSVMLVLLIRPRPSIDQS